MHKKKIIKVLVIFILVISTFITSGIFINNKYLEKNVVEANRVNGVLNIIGKNNPINIALSKEIRDIEKKEEARLEEARVEKQRLEEVEELERQTLEEVERLKEAERVASSEKNTEEKFEFDKNKKMAYLTFDDGPSAKSTDAILDILAEYNIKATFFVVGKMIETNPEVLHRTFKEGHAIGNHSFSHDYGYIYNSSKNFMEDLERADQAIKDVLGQDFETKIMRFPGGSFGKQKLPMIKPVTDAGYRYFDWNSLTGDSEGILMPKEYLIRRFKETYKNQSELIVLMHDTDAKTTTTESLGSIVEFLIEEGYEFGVID